MTDLKTTFAGLSLRNPIIISSSGLTNSAGKNKRLAEAGAGAIVLKSLFEEQIMLEADQLKDPAFYPEASDYLEEYIREHKLAEYLTLIKESKKECNIPIIASINCYSDAEWIDFAKQIQEAGADALEINILALQSDVQYTYGSFEQRHIDILRHIKRTVSIPVIMKLGDNLTNPVALIDQLYANGAAAVVLFNRFYQPDINIENMEQISGAVFSTSADLATPLRWIGCSLRWCFQSGSSSKSNPCRSYCRRSLQRCLSEHERIHRRIHPLLICMDGTERFRKHRSVQRKTEY